MITLGNYLRMDDSTLDKVITENKQDKSKLAKLAGIAGLGLMSLLPNSTYAAEQAKAKQTPAASQKATIEALDVQLGNSKFFKVNEGEAVVVPYNTDIYVVPQEKTLQTKQGLQKLRTDMMLMRQTTDNKWDYMSDAQGRRMVMNGRMNPEDYGINEGEKIKVELTLETLTQVFQTTHFYLVQGRKTTSPEQRTGTNSTTTDGKTSSGNANGTTKHPGIRTDQFVEQKKKKEKKSNESDNNANDQNNNNNSENSNARTSLMFGFSHASMNYTLEVDPFKNGFGGVGQIEVEGNKYLLFAGARGVQFNEIEPYLSGLAKMSLSAWNAGAHVRKGPLMIGAEALGSSVSYGTDSGILRGNYGFPESSVFGYNGRAGLVLGNGFNSDKFVAQAFMLYGKLVQEQKITDARYRNIVTDSQEFTEKGFGLTARINDAVRASYYKTSANNDAGLTLESSQFSGELSIGLGKTKSFRPFVRYTDVSQTEKGPGARTHELNYGEAAAGFRYILGKKN